LLFEQSDAIVSIISFLLLMNNNIFLILRVGIAELAVCIMYTKKSSSTVSSCSYRKPYDSNGAHIYLSIILHVLSIIPT